MDLFERFSSKFGRWYEGRFGAGSGELQPTDILRKITAEMEGNRKEGFDGKVYVPNKYVLELAVDDPDERDYLLSFLDEEELTGVLERFLEENHYLTRGPLDFTVAEIADPDRAPGREKLRVKARFEKGAQPVSSQFSPTPESPDSPLRLRRGVGGGGSDDRLGGGGSSDLDVAWASLPADSDEPSTIAAVAWAALAVTAVDGRKNHYSLTRPITTIGRSRNSGNDIVLSGDGMVSKQHARIERERDNRFTIYDLGSTNGVTVNDARIQHNQTLAPNDEIIIGATRLVFQQADADPPDREVEKAPPAGEGNLSREPSTPDPRGARLISSSGDDHVLGSETTIGRVLTADIVFDEPSVSSRHAKILASDPATYYLEDLGSEHGTSVNGRAMLPGQRALLANGDVIAFGNRVVQFDGGSQ